MRRQRKRVHDIIGIDNAEKKSHKVQEMRRKNPPSDKKKRIPVGRLVDDKRMREQ